MKQLPTFEDVSKRLNYEPDTGLLRWKINNGRARAGAIAGTFTHGYTRINVFGSLQLWGVAGTRDRSRQYGPQ